MKETTLDIDGFISEKAKEVKNPTINTIAIIGLNYSSISLLSQAPNGEFYWSDIDSSYGISEVDGKGSFKNANEAIFRALTDGKTVYSFDSIYEFSEWVTNRKQTS